MRYKVIYREDGHTHIVILNKENAEAFYRHLRSIGIKVDTFEKLPETAIKKRSLFEIQQDIMILQEELRDRLDEIKKIRDFAFNTDLEDLDTLEMIYNCMLEKGLKMYDEEKGVVEVFNTVGGIYPFFMYSARLGYFVQVRGVNDDNVVIITQQEFYEILKDL